MKWNRKACFSTLKIIKEAPISDSIAYLMMDTGCMTWNSKGLNKSLFENL